MPATVRSRPKRSTVTPIRSRIWGARATNDAVMAPLTKNCAATATSARRSRVASTGPVIAPTLRDPEPPEPARNRRPLTSRCAVA